MKTSNLKSVPVFLLAALTATWMFWIPAALLSSRGYTQIVMLLHYIGGAIPFILTVWIVVFAIPKEERVRFIHNLIDFKRIEGRWWLAIFLMIPSLTFLSAGMNRILGLGGGEVLHITVQSNNWFSVIPLAFFLLLFGPIPEEIAWRGYALDRSLRNNSPFTASLVIGIFWLLWHLPLFFIAGTYQQSLGFGTAAFWLFVLDKIPFTILLTWIYTGTGASVLSAIFFHFMINFTGEMIDLGPSTETIYIGLLWLVAYTIILWRKEEWFSPQIAASND